VPGPSRSLPSADSVPRLSSPLLLLHGFTDTSRTWDLVLPMLERSHDVFAPTLLGHYGGPPLNGEITRDSVADAVERALDERGWGVVDIAGNSMGGYLALELAARGRARSVVAFAPAGGWARDDDSYKETMGHFTRMQELVKQAAPNADAIAASEGGRRAATQFITTNWEHIPADLIAHQIRGAAGCDAAAPLIDLALREGWQLDLEKVTCPVRIVWGTDDRVLPWPRAAVRYREGLPQADWVELEGIGHCPQLDVPLDSAQLILGMIDP
jgi:pimeloyl-ACP methyl ester carboxylesterase